MRLEETPHLKDYLEQLLAPQGTLGATLREARSHAQRHARTLNLEGISLSTAEASFLKWAAARKPAKKAVEIGTLTGGSGVAILEALEVGGTLWTLEKNSVHSQMARSVLEPLASALQKTVHILEGDARETLKDLSRLGPFDFVFIDGNKAAYGDYLKWAESHLEPGGALVADNVFLGGEIGLEEGVTFSKKQIQVMRQFNERLLKSSEWKSVLVPTQEGLIFAERVG
ncbi:MAG: O-methyltransferase [Bdellovibrionales bacterium]